MRQIHAKPISHAAFAPYGRFYHMDKPEGHALRGEIHRFFPDRLSADSTHRLGYSVLCVEKPEQMWITQQEYHTTTWEMILPLNDDMLLHCAPPSAGVPVGDLAEVFLVPRHTLVLLNAAVWHLAPLPAREKLLTAMIVLPECTYMNDCTVVDLPPEQQFEIVG